MPQCPQCGGNQPTDELLESHVNRFCRVTLERNKAAAAVAVLDGSEPLPAALDPVSTNGHAPQPAAQVAGAGSQSDGIFHPVYDRNYTIPTGQAGIVEIVLKLASDAPQNLLLVGPPGTGKTSLPKQMAAKTGRPFALIPFGKMQEVSQVFGERLFSPERGTYYQKSLLWEATETENCVVCLDEINRCDNPKVANGLQNLLDNNRQTWVDEIQAMIRVAPGVIFVLTMNEGLEYSGIDPFDSALRSRCRVLDMGYPPRSTAIAVLVGKTGITTAQAAKLMDVVSPDSTQAPMRSLIFAGEFLKAGATYRQAIMTGFSTLDKRELEGVLRRAQDADGGGAYTESWTKW